MKDERHVRRFREVILGYGGVAAPRDLARELKLTTKEVAFVAKRAGATVRRKGSMHGGRTTTVTHYALEGWLDDGPGRARAG